MSWTYDNTQFESTTAGTYTGSTVGVRYQVRFMIQDISTSRQLVQDQEIDWIQTQEMNSYMTAAAICDMLVAKGGIIKRKKIDELDITYDPMFYRELGGKLRARGMSYQVPYAGGISVADKLAAEADTDWVAPLIMRNLDNNPQAPGPSSPAVNQGAGSNPLTSI
jgi:hypothetical protein